MPATILPMAGKAGPTSMADIDITQPAFRVVQPKPKMTVYFALLIVALCAMLTACGFMYAEVRRLQREKSSSLDRPTKTLVASARFVVICRVRQVRETHLVL